MPPTQLALPGLWRVMDLAQPFAPAQTSSKKINGAAARHRSPRQELSRDSSHGAIRHCRPCAGSFGCRAAWPGVPKESLRQLSGTTAHVGKTSGETRLWGGTEALRQDQRIGARHCRLAARLIPPRASGSHPRLTHENLAATWE